LQQTYASPALPLQQLPVSGNYYQVTWSQAYDSLPLLILLRMIC
jgi:hypothetical protein